MEYILFDLDGTLYSGATTMFDQVRANIRRWLMQALSVSAEEAFRLNNEYFQTYGTTMAGLLRHHPEVDIEDYLRAVHQVDVGHYLHPSPELAAMLASLPVHKVVFTNAIHEWGERVLTALGIREHFEAIIDVRTVHYLGKPHPTAYQKALAQLHTTATECVMVEDQARNLAPAHEIGMRTVWVGEQARAGGHVDFAAPDLPAAGPILRRLCAEENKKRG